MKKIAKVEDEQVLMRINSHSYYSEESFIADLENYYKSAMDGTLLFSVISNREAGQTIKIMHLVKIEHANRYSIRNFKCFLECLGFKMSKKHESAVCVSGGGMDLICHTHNHICEYMQRIGMIDSSEYKAVTNVERNTI